MADICVLYLSDDHSIAERLVELLRRRWRVWWAGDIVHGDWEEAVRAEVPHCSIIVSILSDTAKGSRMSILKDEMRFAKGLSKPILPFVVGAPEVPMGFGDLDQIDALGWSGDEGQAGFGDLVARIASILSKSGGSELQRPRTLNLGKKELHVPSFVFSISSFETRLQPADGLPLLRALQPGAALVSAYDAWDCGGVTDCKRFAREFRRLVDSPTVVVLDSGNYEASRKKDHYLPRRNPNGWRRKDYREVVARLVPDVAFNFDLVDPVGSAKSVISRIIRDFEADRKALRGTGVVLCPIVHLPVNRRAGQGELAAMIVREVALAVDPLAIAIPERELGEGLRQRAASVRMIRESLNTLGRYYPLHLLGTGNPLSMWAFAVAGADLFDGLEWCRTVVDYRNGFLFHFQQFDMVGEACLGRVRDEQIRAIARNPGVPYTTRVLAYNIDYFKDSARTMHDLIHSGQQKSLLNMIPDIGPILYDELCQPKGA